MTVAVRLMELRETRIIIDYFWRATPEHLEILGVDPTRLPAAEAWRRQYDRLFELPLEQRSSVLVLWLDDGEPIGFATADKIVYGEHANMHLHMVDAGRRGRGTGTECVRETVELYFDLLKLTRLYCEPNAFNVAPNRTLQKAGFAYRAGAAVLVAASARRR